MFEVVAGEIGDERTIDRVLDGAERSTGECECDQSDQAETIARDEDGREQRDDADADFRCRDREPTIESIREYAAEERHEQRRATIPIQKPLSASALATR